MSGEGKPKKNRSVMWNYFQKIDQKYARCSMCSKLCSFGSTVTNLKRHLERVHPNLDFKTVDVQMMRAVMPGGGNRKTSKVWDIFTQLGEGRAKCGLCLSVFSYRSSTTNLAKHLLRKHKSSDYSVLGNEEDPREGLKEFIHLDGDGVATGEEERDDADGQLRDGDTDWAAPSRKLRKLAPATTTTKRIKPEVISSNGVDYVIYSHEQPRTSAPTLIPARPLVPQTPTRTPMAPTPRPVPPAPAQVEDEFTTFAKFLSQRIRSFKDPYWQSCAINEINIALHKVEMRRYEPPRAVPTSVISVQTDSFELPIISHSSTLESQEIVEEIVSSEDA